MELSTEVPMLPNRTSRLVQKLSQTVAIVIAIAGAHVVIGSSGWADEFIVTDTAGEPLRNARVEIEDDQDRVLATMYTDGQGHLVVPYRGRGARYQMVYEGRATTLEVDGGRTLKEVSLE